MERKKIEHSFKIYDSIEDLSLEESALMQQAIDQMDYAYAPYSNFLVGAALLLDNGETYRGSNQENASYPLCMCAERVALYSMGALNKKFIIKLLAITAKNLKKKHNGFCMPCGACRQVIQEYEQRQGEEITLILSGEDGRIMRVEGIDSILPMSFSKEDLI